MKKFFLIIFVSQLSCTPALYIPSEKNVPAGANLEELKEGRSLYVDHCGSCHRLHLPTEYSVESWKTKLIEMQKKAKISDREKNLIFGYVTISHPQNTVK